MKRPSPATIIASTALFFSLAGTGLAANHYLITSTKQIKPGVLSSLRGPRGPQGPQGAAGTPGTAGAAGAAGAAGSFSTASVSAVVGAAPGPPGLPADTTNNGQATSVASCPAGTKVIGGGYTWGGTGAAPANVTVVTDQEQGKTGWVVTLQNNTATAISPQFAASALCG